MISFPAFSILNSKPISKYPLQSKDLEQILQAVKKTQVKLVNKQIQEIQDSKNFPKNELLSDKPTQFEIESKEKIEQNQKVVDDLIEYNDECLANLRPYDYIISEILNMIYRNTTGKNIKDRNN